MPMCFYRCADELDAHAAQLDAADPPDDPDRPASAERLRQLAREIRRDTSPCEHYPRCGCGTQAPAPMRRTG